MKFTGIYVPLVTPFKADKSLDIETLKTLVQSFIDKGVSGLVVCGTTGEYYTFSEEERHTVLTTVASIAKGKVMLIAGINDLSTEGACRRAKEAEALGYEAFMLAPPAYSLPDQAGIIAHYETVAKATNLPIIMYNFPARVGIEIEYETVVHLSKNPNIAGIKESSGDFSRALRLLQTDFKDFEVVCGCDDQPVDFFFWGAKSWIAGAGNVFPEEQVALFNATQNSDWDLARQIMKKIYPAIHSMESGNYNQKAKLGCLKATLDVGTVRLPLSDISQAEQEEFLAFFR
ncbi:4-hydroxy-tetrahydrodipicolinate synthase [Wohlfahrtiimonas chitiniclastica]|uniref:4-hydroxy-tetrahydrodipicolinate synthase n=1 Tax=Wohlfahrtiimonas chitiniclastica TaxID=400946 RepID=UPI000B98FF97|nr:4-hydroxy-tetrahydrodipicolinate synthase [Wohlfahrtiimonas chitiniclastica]OYQ80463.1 4-hydroxy-tetrahydrodipicolinate synthase [Wohlfahrtiimonas chitiniclastica]